MSQDSPQSAPEKPPETSKELWSETFQKLKSFYRWMILMTVIAAGADAISVTHSPSEPAEASAHAWDLVPKNVLTVAAVVVAMTAAVRYIPGIKDQIVDE